MMILNNIKLSKIASLFLLIFFSFQAFTQEKLLTLEQIWLSPELQAKSLKGINSMENGSQYSIIESEGEINMINLYDYKSGKKIKTICTSSIFKEYSEKINENLLIEDYQFSKDEKKLLLATNTESIYRHSTASYYFIYDLITKTLTPLNLETKQRLASFSPDGFRVAFVAKNNLYIYEIENNRVQEVTFDGAKNNIINGATDWVYEEEFGFDKAYEWSPDGTKLVYMKFDETEVKEFLMPIYGTLYPTENRFKYPKAGEKNSIVSVFVYDCLTNTQKPVELGINPDQYIPKITWTNDNQYVLVLKLNRLQNHISLIKVSVNGRPQAGLAVTTILEEKSDTYIDASDQIIEVLNNNTHFAWISDKDGFRHIYLYDLEGKEIKQLTNGNWDIDEYLGFDKKTNKIYYTSSEVSSTDRNLYSIDINTNKISILTPEKGTHKITFSKDFSLFIDHFSNSNTAANYTLYNNSGKKIREILNNEDLNKKIKSLNVPQKEFFTIKTTEGIELNAWQIKPHNFDENKKYPVLMFVYGGPGSQTVVNKWQGHGTYWYHYLAQQGYIVVSVDNRGTGAKGRDFKNITYQQLGKYETQDQIFAAKEISKWKYVDAKKIAIQGWSYGGYMSSLCITKGADIFKAAIAVAPVTNWRFYDSIYTERYMRTPQENPDGYDDNSPINHVDKLRGKYLLVHGTADDNVHFQNSAEMVNALIEANKHFDFYMYPNKDHGIHGGISRYHLYTKMTNFLKTAL
jgi:dipeptidyl-peptidase 4